MISKITTLSKIVLPVILVLFMVSACKTRKKAIATVPEATEVLTATDISRKALAANFSDKWINGRMSVDYKSAGVGLGFNASIRMRKDSILWASITPGLGIEAVRVVLTTDSLKILNRLSNKYFLGNYSFLEKMMGVKLEFKDIQSLLLGNYFEYQNTPYKKAYLAHGQYVLENPGVEPLTVIKVLGNNFRVTNYSFEDKTAKRKLDVDYSDFTQVGTGIVPFNSKTKVVAAQSIDLDITWIKIDTGSQLEFPFSIPSKYEPMD